jgi:hypothetical protein
VYDMLALRLGLGRQPRGARPGRGRWSRRSPPPRCQIASKYLTGAASGFVSGEDEAASASSKVEQSLVNDNN